jgi:meiosis arrest female protein 1
MAPQSRIPFSKFIPAYHHHFGRQCRVADYGYTRLIDLLESLSHVVQVLLSFLTSFQSLYKNFSYRF